MGKFGKSSNKMDDDWGYPHLWKPHEPPIWRNSNWIHQAVENPNSDHHSLSCHFQENNMFAASQPFLRSSGFKDIFQPQPLHAVCLDPFSIGCTKSAARPKKHAVSLSSKQVVWTRIIYTKTQMCDIVFLDVLLGRDELKGSMLAACDMQWPWDSCPDSAHWHIGCW